MLTSASYDTSTDILFEKLGCIDLQSQRKIAKGILVHKALNGFAPDYLAQMFTERSIITYYTLRDTGDKLALPQARTNYLKYSFGYSGAVLWNSLPNEVRQANTLSHQYSNCVNTPTVRLINFLQSVCHPR